MDQDFAEQRKEKFAEALKQTYAGCMFDIDGTLTVRGDEFIPAFMHEELATMSMSIPMAICSARKLSHAYEKLAPIFTRAPNPGYCQSNWILVCENGSIGYYYDSEKKEYIEFFRVPYPYPVGHRDSLFSRLNGALEGKLGTSFVNEVSMVFRPVKYDDTDREAVAARSLEIAKIINQSLDVYDPKKLLKTGNSGIGVSVFPYYGNKDNGTVQFAQYLRQKKGMMISPEAKELIVVGDQPGPFGNDESFLNGKVGTPFTVGDICEEHLYPLPVYHPQTGQIVSGPEGTMTLLQLLKFRNES